MASSNHSENIVNNLAKEAGVPVDAAHKMLKTLGLDALITNITEAAGATRMERLSVGDLKIAAKLGRSSVAV